MNSRNFSTPKSARTRADQKDKDIQAFYVFMLWAYEEVENTFEDEFLEIAIHTIVYHLSKHYGTGLNTPH